MGQVRQEEKPVLLYVKCVKEVERLDLVKVSSLLKELAVLALVQVGPLQILVKSVSGSTSELARDKTKTTKNRLPSVRAFGRACARVRKGLGDGSERRLDRPGLPTCRPKRPTWRPRRPTWRPRRPNLRPKAVPSASWSDLTTT